MLLQRFFQTRPSVAALAGMLAAVALLTGLAGRQPAEAAGSRGLHLASYRDPASFEAGWRALTQRHPELRSLRTTLRLVDVPGKGPFHRLVAGPLEADRARELCATLKARGQYCAVVEFTGQVQPKPAQDLEVAVRPEGEGSVSGAAAKPVRLTLMRDGRAVAEEVRAYDDGARLYAPLGAVCRAAGLHVDVNPRQGSAIGFIGGQDRTFKLSVGAGMAWVGGEPMPLPRDAVRLGDEDIYVGLGLLGRWFPLHLRLSEPPLRLHLMPKGE
jgi:hypothetical protein